MVSVSNVALAVILLFILGVSMLNPGGFIIATLIALVILGLVLLVPFAQEYVLSVNKGAKAARKKPGSDTGGQGRDGGSQKE